MSALVFEQAQTIENQKSLIRQLFSDSVALTNLRMEKLLHDKHR